MEAETESALFRFGVIADVQHADLDSGASYWGRLRHYRDAVEKARKAAAAWTEQKCIFGLDLGDIIDRFAFPNLGS